MFVKYPSDNERDSAQMWEPATNGIIMTSNVIWKRKSISRVLLIFEIEPRLIGMEVEDIGVDDINDTTLNTNNNDEKH